MSKLNSSYAPSTIMSFGTYKVLSALTLIVVFVELLVPDWVVPGLKDFYGVEHLLHTLYVFIFKHIFISLSVIILVYFCWTDDNIKIEFFYLHEWLPLFANIDNLQYKAKVSTIQLKNAMHNLKKNLDGKIWRTLSFL